MIYELVVGLEGCLAMPGLKAAGCQAKRLSDYVGLKGCWLLGWTAVCFLPGLKADCLPGWRAVWLPSGLKDD